MKRMLFTCYVMVCSVYAELIDLEKNCQDFFLETKQIHVPGFPGAFNPCIVRWHDRFLMSFRVRNEHMVSTFDIGLVWLDDDFNPVDGPQVLDFPEHTYLCASKKQDPRLIAVGDALYMVYSDFVKIGDIATRRMFIAQVHSEHGQFTIDNPLCLHPFEGCSERWEKNWPPFVHDDQLLLAYSLIPHRIFKPSLESGACDTVTSTYSAIDWPWGELRGGTSALRVGDEYLAFFHSSILMPTVHSDGKKMQHYVMGAYTFSSKPPFEITRMSPEPIVAKGFYTSPAYNTWKPLRVVFPMGFIVDGDVIWLSYGKQDFEIWVAKIDKEALYASLVSCAFRKFQEKRTDSTYHPTAGISPEYECS